MDVIATHNHADFDGLASMLAAGKLFPNAKLVLPGGAQDSVRGFLAAHDLGLTRLKDLDLSLVTRLILVDTHDPERVGSLRQCLDDPRVEVWIFDHHNDTRHVPMGECNEQRIVRMVEPVGATTTILVEQLRVQQIALTPFEATVLALGLYEETGSFAFASTTGRDLAAGSYVVDSGADLNLVAETLHRPLDPDAIALLNDLLEHREVHYLEGQKVLVATSTIDRCRGEAAGVVHLLAEVEGVDAVVVAVPMENKVEIIGRSRKPEIDVGWIAREFGGGGHAVASAASVKGQTLAEVKERLVRLLTTHYRPTLLARNVMTKPVKVIGWDTTANEAGEQMTTYGVNVFPVVDDKGRYVGLVSRELIQKTLFHRLGKMAVNEIMQTEAYTAHPDTPFHEIELAMVERNQRFVPILEGPIVVGVITRTDLLRTLHDDVLKTARKRTVTPIGSDRTEWGPHRNVRNLMRDRLPHPIAILLEESGQLADRCGISLFVVGGFVRDLLLGIENLDVDLVVEGDGIMFARKLAEAMQARVKTHDRFGTAIVVLPDGFKLDVATARTEFYEYPTALPTVEQSSIRKDLYRRDFTINALAVRLNGKGFGDVLDFYGGQRDLKDKMIRVLHSLSFVEDPTRVFRAVRFETRFGFRLGRDTLSLIEGAVKMELFHRLSGHRLLEELKPLLGERNPKRAMKRLADLNLLQFIHPQLSWSARLENLLDSAQEAIDWHRLLYLDRKLETWLVYMMMLMEVISDRSAKEALKRFPFTESEAAKVRVVRTESHSILRRLAKRPPLQPAEVYRLLSGLPDEAILALMAMSKGEAAKRQISAHLTTYQHTKPTLTGADLKAMGLKPGPQFKKILNRLLEARLNGEAKSDSEERALAAKLAAKSG